MLKVQVISRETIKPSSPTPPHLRSYKLTLLDRFSPPCYMPYIFYYTNNEEEEEANKSSTSSSVAEKIRKLKQSLSETLTLYYPLAGRLPEEEEEEEEEGAEVGEVECNDEGVELCEARVEGRLREFLQRPYVELLDRLVPCSLWSPRSGIKGVIAAQLNVFDCGGIAIGVCAFHKVLDGVSLAQFMNAWASSTSHGGRQVQAPLLHASQLFPTRGLVPPLPATPKANIVGRRFVFDAAKIEALRADRQSGQRPSRIVAVSALVWRCMMRAHREQLGGGRVAFGYQTVDLRRRMSPPSHPALFGVVISMAPIIVTDEELHGHDVQRCLEGKMTDAIKGIDGDHIKVLQQPDGIHGLLQASLSALAEYDESKVDAFSFSSWCGFPFYEVDFGWGKPAWVSACSMASVNLVILLDSREGDGIEAWVNMEDLLMGKLVQDQELLQYASSA